MKIRVDGISSLDRKAWDAYVFAHPRADHYHLSGWGHVIKLAYGYPPLYFTVWKEQTLAGILPGVIMGGMLRRKSLVSLPYLDYGGICADTPEVRQGLYEAAQHEGAKRRARLLDLRHRYENLLPLPQYSDKVTLVLDLESDTDQMWKKLGAKLRNQIRKAEKEHLQAQWTGAEGIEDFYRVYVHNMRDLGSPPHSRRFFRQLLAEFLNTRLLLVRRGREVIGGALCLVFRETMLVPWASSLRTYFRLCPNNLLYWEAIRTACEEGLRWFDFGRSSRGSGTYQFKRQWGAVEEPLHWQANLPGGDGIDEASSPLLGCMVQAWKRLPVGLTRMIGPVVRRRLSN
jgi:FemAB-related protein (PEP-CTERM system-associated)